MAGWSGDHQAAEFAALDGHQSIGNPAVELIDLVLRARVLDVLNEVRAGAAGAALGDEAGKPLGGGCCPCGGGAHIYILNGLRKIFRFLPSQFLATRCQVHRQWDRKHVAVILILLPLDPYE